MGRRAWATRAIRTVGAVVVAILAVAALAALGACADFADPSTVKDLRVLAVRAEPSEIILAPTDPSTPPPIPPITLQPLIVDPKGNGRDLTVTVTACANDPGGMAPPGGTGDPTGFPAGGARTTVGSDLCDGAPTEIALAADVPWSADAAPIPVQLTPEWVVAAFMRDVFPGPDGKLHGGFDLGMPVVFQLTVHAGADTVKAIKRVTFWSHAVTDSQTPNVTPEIRGKNGDPDVTAYDLRDETTAEPLPGARMPLEHGTAWSVPADGVWIDPAPAEAEPYVTVVLDRQTGDAKPDPIPFETLSYQFFATAGTFSPFQTSNVPPVGVVVTRPHIESKYKPPASADRPADGMVTIWIVVRDDRGGESWIDRALVLPAP